MTEIYEFMLKYIQIVIYNLFVVVIFPLQLHRLPKKLNLPRTSLL